jgi:hypothetical protein
MKNSLHRCHAVYDATVPACIVLWLYLCFYSFINYAFVIFFGGGGGNNIILLY